MLKLTQLQLTQLKIRSIKVISLSLLCVSMMGLQKSASAQSETYPNRPIKMIVSFTAGGTTDILAREVANQLTQRLKVPVIVENRPGAAGNLGTEIVGKSAPDGYTLLVNSSGPISVNPTLFKNLAVNPLTDLDPVALLAEVPNVLIVPSSSKINSVKDLIEFGRANMNKVNYGSTGIGTASHMTGFMFSQQSGINATHIPYKGAEAVRDLIAGRLDYMFATLPSVAALIKGGQVRAIGISIKKRYVTLPEVPTMLESGINMAAGSWFGVFAPHGTSPENVKMLNQQIVEILMSKKTKDKLINEGAEPIAMNVTEFTKFVRNEYETWAPIVRSSGAKPE